jgi:hypothetical protein
VEIEEFKYKSTREQLECCVDEWVLPVTDLERVTRDSGLCVDIDHKYGLH